jgi:ribosomal protein S12 methylthiotransferase
LQDPKRRFYLLSLGCPKNDVDSDFLASCLIMAGWEKMERPQEAGLLVVNTCSFIASAVEETVEAVLEISDLREEGFRYLVVTGCLVARYGVSSLASLLPEVDLFVDFPDYPRFATLMNSLSKGPQGEDTGGFTRKHASTLDKGYVYIKISEGCRRRCAYCAIPAIRGPLLSRTWGEIVEEARFFVDRGARELVLVAQDTTSYGLDLYGSPSLPLLVERLAELDGDFRLRVMYMHPEGIDREVLESMRHPKVCSYLDIPFQHADPAVLKAMGRKGGVEEHRRLLDLVEKCLGEVALRSTFMVGFPGEDGESFRRLYDFVAETRFDWLGLFRYSQEGGTPAFSLGRGVTGKVGQDRLGALAELQEEIMREKALGLVGRSFRVLVEGKSPEAPGYWEARSWREAPEIDGVIFVPQNGGLHPGTFYEVEISDSEGIDLVGIHKDQEKEIEENRGRG